MPDMTTDTVNDELFDALEALWGYVEDLQKSNPGYVGKLCLQDYGQMVRAIGSAPVALENARKAKCAIF